ncbi:MAG: GNAT family N-acetyltransferase [Deltaproteobacteria bacterium]|nr:GNAT family N-acetyltransferase [Deltaproteobacteria bacterium]
MTGLRIREITRRDLEPTVAVWQRSRAQGQPWVEERMGYTQEQNRKHFRDVVMRQEQVWVAEEGDAIVGLLSLAAGQVGQLFVDPPAQGRGVGSALLQKAKLLWPQGLTLFTFQRNERARAFYERRGFRAVTFGISPEPESEPDVKYVWEPDVASDPAPN